MIFSHHTSFLLLMILTGFTSCVQSGQQQSATGEVALEDLQLSPVVHDSLTRKQLNDIKRIQRALAEVVSTSLEETITNFRRDRNPDREIAIWLKMADAYERFTLNKHFEEHDKKDEAFQLLLLRSMMSENDVLNKIKVNYLSPDEVRELFNYYAEPPRPIMVEK